MAMSGAIDGGFVSAAPRAGAVTGVAVIRRNLESIESTFLLLSVDEKQKAIAVIVRFVQKLQDEADRGILKQKTPPPERFVKAENCVDEKFDRRVRSKQTPQFLQVEQSLQPLELDDLPRLLLAASPRPLEQQQSPQVSDRHRDPEIEASSKDQLTALDDVVDDDAILQNCALEVDLDFSASPGEMGGEASAEAGNVADSIDSAATEEMKGVDEDVEDNSRRSHLYSDFVWDDEDDEDDNEVQDKDDDSWEPGAKVARMVTRKRRRRRGAYGESPKKRRTGTGVVGDFDFDAGRDGGGDDVVVGEERINGVGICGDEDDGVEAVAAWVLDKMIDCVERGIEYEAKDDEEEKDPAGDPCSSTPAPLDRPHLETSLAERTMLPYKVRMSAVEVARLVANGALETKDNTPAVTSTDSSTLPTCLSCGAVFQRRRQLGVHLRDDHEAAALSCRRCRCQFLNPAEWLHHGPCGSSRTPSGTPIAPTEPSTGVSKFSWPTSPVIDLYSCPICGVLMESALGLQRHLLNHVRNQCRVCLQLFPTKKLLSSHLQSSHDASISDSKYICRFCQRRFSKITALYLHLKVHADGEQRVCLKCGFLSETQIAFEKHMQAHALHAQFACDKCSSTFDRAQYLQSHLKSHQKWDCSMCDEKHSQRREFEQHCRRAHGLRLIDVRSFSCPHCPSIDFPSRYKLGVHIAESHADARPHVCRICKRSFDDEAKLTKHLESETHRFKAGIANKESLGVEFACDKCDATFDRKERLDRHLKTHEPDRPFQCILCPFSCKEKANLKNHLKRHTSERDFVCRLCGAGFQTKKTLEDHNTYVHSDQRDFACEDCPRAFKSSKDLQRHARSVHANLRPHICKVCDKAFKRKANVRRHLLTSHGISLPTTRVKKFDRENESSVENSSTSTVDPGAVAENLLETGRRVSKEKFLRSTPSSKPTPRTSTIVAVESSAESSFNASRDSVLRRTLIAESSAIQAPQKAPVSMSSGHVDSLVSAALPPVARMVPPSTRKIDLATYQRQPATHRSASKSAPQLGAADPMTEIIVTVDPNGAIMGVDAGSEAESTLLRLDGPNGETTLIPLQPENSSLRYTVETGQSLHANVSAPLATASPSVANGFPVSEEFRVDYAAPLSQSSVIDSPSAPTARGSHDFVVCPRFSDNASGVALDAATELCVIGDASSSKSSLHFRSGADNAVMAPSNGDTNAETIVLAAMDDGAGVFVEGGNGVADLNGAQEIYYVIQSQDVTHFM